MSPFLKDIYRHHAIKNHEFAKAENVMMWNIPKQNSLNDRISNTQHL